MPQIIEFEHPDYPEEICKACLFVDKGYVTFLDGKNKPISGTEHEFETFENRGNESLLKGRAEKWIEEQGGTIVS